MEPKITLKGFVGNWDTHAIKDICEVNPKSTLPSEFEYVDLESVVGTEMISHRTEQRGSAPSRAQRLAKKGDIFYQTVRPYQKNNYLFDMDETNYVFSTGYAQLRTKINQGYLFTLMQSPSFVNKVLLECTGTSYPAINPTNLSKITIDIVDDENIQRIIASYFQHLDSLIQSTTKKIESLKQVKVASLQSMFPQEGETTPRVRFKGFDGEWELNPLSSFAKKSTEKNGAMNYTITLTNSAEHGVVNQRDFFDHDISNDENIHGYYVVHNDDFVYNPRISSTAPVGPISRNQLGYSGVMSPLYLIFKVEGIDKDFLSYFFKTMLWHKYMKYEGNTGARFDRLAISDTQFFNMPIIMPIQENEQKAIANYFTSLDSQISLQTQRLEKLKQIKSACLDNMFV